MFHFQRYHCYDSCFVTYVRPLLEYASCVWSPYLLKHIKRIESVQKRLPSASLLYLIWVTQNSLRPLDWTPLNLGDSIVNFMICYVPIKCYLVSW